MTETKRLSGNMIDRRTVLAGAGTLMAAGGAAFAQSASPAHRRARRGRASG